jgi:hypothetical protein
MFRTYPLRTSKPASRPEGLRAIFRRLEQELEREPRTIRRPLPTAAVRHAHA